MPWQLIYTSAPRGLLSGQSGFCTVARSANLRDALAQRLEQISSYHYLRVAEAATAHRNPTVSAFRLLDLRGAKYYVLTRIQPCGLDFTSRTNHLAHHLVFLPDELAALPSPAAILRHWPGWMATWRGDPRLLEEAGLEAFALPGKSFLPAQTWKRVAGDGGKAAGLLQSECVQGCYLICPPGGEEQLLDMYCETLQLLNFNGQFPLRPWRHTFTTFLQAEDNPNDFQWRGCQENTPAHKQALTRSAPLIPLQAVRVPPNSLVQLARDGPVPVAVLARPAAPSTPPASAPASSPVLPATVSPRREVPRRPPQAPISSLLGVKLGKLARSDRPALLDVNIWISPATLARVGLVAAVLIVLFVVKLRSARPPANPDKSAPVADARAAVPGPPAVEAAPIAPVPATTPPSASPPVTPSTTPPAPKPPPEKQAPKTLPNVATVEAKGLRSLLGDGPTYLFAVTNLVEFNLPIESAPLLEAMLNRAGDSTARSEAIQVDVYTNRLDYLAGTRMTLRQPRGARRFSVSTPEPSRIVCDFDYASWLDRNRAPLRVRARFDLLPTAFSLRFRFPADKGFAQFRLLIVNPLNPPEPLLFQANLIHTGGEKLKVHLAHQVREFLSNNLVLLAPQRWQLRPFLQTKTGSPWYVYEDLNVKERPEFGDELDFAKIGRRLQAEKKELEKQRTNLKPPQDLPLGLWLGSTEADLQSFLAFSKANPDTRGLQGVSDFAKTARPLESRRFLAYLEVLQRTAPNDSWIKQWQSDFDSASTDDVPRRLENLYLLWTEKQQLADQDLRAPVKRGTTNWFFATWNFLRARESIQDDLGWLETAQGRLSPAKLGLWAVDGAGHGLEVIRFDAP
jgi:hypothetical protein